MHLSELITVLLEGIEEYGDLEVFCSPQVDAAEDIIDVFRSGDGEVIIRCRP